MYGRGDQRPLQKQIWRVQSSSRNLVKHDKSSGLGRGLTEFENLCRQEEPRAIRFGDDLFLLIRQDRFCEGHPFSSFRHDPFCSQWSLDVWSVETDLHLHRSKVLVWSYSGGNGYSHSCVCNVGHYSSVHGGCL